MSNEDYLINVCKYYKDLPHQKEALRFLLKQIPADVLDKFSKIWSTPQTSKIKTDTVRQINKEGKNLIKHYEGFRGEAYLCPNNVWTIGYGSTFYPDGSKVKKGDLIGKNEAEVLLSKTLEVFEKGVNELVKVKLTDNQFSALVCFAFNIGLFAFENSTLLKKLNNGYYKSVGSELRRWNKDDNGKVLLGLVRRRESEVDLFYKKDINPSLNNYNYLKLTRTNKKDPYGCFILNLEYYRDGLLVDSIPCCSGQPHKQSFRTGVASVPMTYEPLPEGLWYINNIKWASGRKDDWSGSYGSGIGAVSVRLDYIKPGKTRRSAIEIHIDANRNRFPGTAGCVGIYSRKHYERFISWLRETDPRDLYVDWGLGTCPKEEPQK